MTAALMYGCVQSRIACIILQFTEHLADGNAVADQFPEPSSTIHPSLTSEVLMPTITHNGKFESQPLGIG
jgi:hypothetical protein